jgi:hypothetical protein
MSEARTCITEIWCPPAADGTQRLHSPMREAEPEVADHEVALMASEAKWGVSIPDITEAADIAAWRADYADLLSKGAEAVREEIAATNAEFGKQAEAEAEAEAENWYCADYDAEAAEYDVEPEAGL